MKHLLTLICLSIGMSASATIIDYADPNKPDSLFTVYQFGELQGALIYKSESPTLKIYFDEIVDSGYTIVFDTDTTDLIANKPIILDDIHRGDHTLTLIQGIDGETKQMSSSFKVKLRRPWVSNDAGVLGLLMIVLFLIFKTTQMNSFKGFYKYVPALLLCYFIPAALNSLGVVSSEESNLYFVASRYLLPASLVLLCLSIDLKGIIRLGPKAIIMFFTATIGIVIGGPVALWLVSLIAPEVLEGEIWRGLSTVAGSWIGGGANQTAMKEIYGSSDQLFSAMIVVDVFVANVFMSVLLFGTGYDKKLNRFFKADDSAIENLKKKMEDYQLSIAKIPSFNDLIYMLGITFFFVGTAHVIADFIAPQISFFLEELAKTNPLAASLMTSFGSGFFWLIVMATVFGIGLSFTKFRSLEGVGASKMGSVFLYILIATIGMKMDIGELIANWGIFKFLISIGLIWIMIHALFLFIMAKIIKAPFFYVAVGSQANVGGAASAPVVASAFSPSLAPVGVLLAVLGYAVGTFGAILCTILMQSLTL